MVDTEASIENVNRTNNEATPSTSTGWTMFRLILSTSMAGIVSIQRWRDLKVLGEQHRSTTYRMYVLYSSVHDAQQLEFKNRTQALPFLNTLSSAKRAIIEQAHPVPARFIRKYKNVLCTGYGIDGGAGGGRDPNETMRLNAFRSSLRT